MDYTPGIFFMDLAAVTEGRNNSWVNATLASHDTSFAVSCKARALDSKAVFFRYYGERTGKRMKFIDKFEKR